MSTAFERIRDVHMGEWFERFQAKSADYNAEGPQPFEPHTFLGVRGQFADIWRKVFKLHKALWDGRKLTGEQPDEIIQDLIAHLFLTLDLLREPEDPTMKLLEDLGMREVSAEDSLNPSPIIPHSGSRPHCGDGCTKRKHLFAGECRYRLAGDWLAEGEA